MESSEMKDEVSVDRISVCYFPTSQNGTALPSFVNVDMYTFADNYLLVPVFRLFVVVAEE